LDGTQSTNLSSLMQRVTLPFNYLPISAMTALPSKGRLMVDKRNDSAGTKSPATTL